MATGFMPHFISLWLAFVAAGACAADVALVGVIGDKAAVLAVDGGEPKTVRVGQKWAGITVLSVTGSQATVEIDGKRRVLQQGQHYRAAAPASSRQSVTLAADPRGHFIAQGAVNDVPVTFLVDTGATAIALPQADAVRIGLAFRRGERVQLRTASGMTLAYRLQLDQVRIGDIAIGPVEAVVVEQGLDIALLGMSFLNRMEMRREGQNMMLIRRF